MRRRGLLGFLIVSVVSGLQTFVEQPSYTEVNPGDTTVLRCLIANRAGRCSWQKDGFLVGAEQGKYEWTDAQASGDPSDNASGDCSLRVRAADLRYDDGRWVCLVTASSFQTQDALTSQPAVLVVRVEPQGPVLEFGGVAVAGSSEQSLAVREDQPVSVQCRTRHANPPAIISWKLGDRELPSSAATQHNSSEPDRPRTWASVSELRRAFSRREAGQSLTCVADHGAFSPQPQTQREQRAVRQRTAHAQLDVQYSPDVQLLGSARRVLEANVDSTTLECRVDANPPAAVVWRFVAATTGRATTLPHATVRLQPAATADAGTYQCQANNDIGTSAPLTAVVDVEYVPVNVSVRPSHHLTVPLYNTTVLTCSADANPAPTYEWLQRLPDGGAGGEVVVRGAGRQLRIENVTYANSGTYVCVAHNTINGRARRVQSDALDVRITGAPQVMRRRTAGETAVVRGDAAVLQAVFCSNPPPRSAVWSWGSQRLPAGKSTGRHAAAEIRADSQEDCFLSTLEIAAVQPADERAYSLHVTNEHGADTHAISLLVRGFVLLAEPVTMTTVIVIICGCLMLFVLVIALLLYAYKSEKWCFSHKGGFKPTDLESEKSDVDGEPRPSHSVGMIPPDALYSGPRKSTASLSTSADQFDREGGGATNGRAAAGSHVIYADLQLPKTSNNGSMRKQRQHAHRVAVAAAAATKHAPTQYADIKFASASASADI